jgi:hypothetical protein
MPSEQAEATVGNRITVVDSPDRRLRSAGTMNTGPTMIAFELRAGDFIAGTRTAAHPRTAVGP